MIFKAFIVCVNKSCKVPDELSSLVTFEPGLSVVSSVIGTEAMGGVAVVMELVLGSGWMIAVFESAGACVDD